MQRGTTLPELLLVLTIMGILGTIAIPRTVRWRDRTSVRSAALDTVAATLTVRSYSDTIARRNLASSHGVTLSASRDSMAYTPNGLGYGASNLTIVVRRGLAAESIFVSRLGRVRR
jgi:prepilin-type N-terminal cleavage/methylation domain-containing protein